MPRAPRLPTRAHTWLAFLLGAVLVAGALPACGRGDGEPAPGSDGRLNVLLLSIDTLRADHLGCYGYERDTSPHLDRFAAGSLRYDHAFAPTPWTLPSHAAMLTGRHPHELGIVSQESSLPEEVPRLAELLGEAGYRTAAFVDSTRGGFLGSRRGFDRGFELYQHAPHDETSSLAYDMALTVDVGLDWLEQRDPDAPFFLFLHTKSVHAAPGRLQQAGARDAPYQTRDPFTTRYLRKGRVRFSWTSEGGSGVSYLKGINAGIAAGQIDPAAFPPARLAELVDLYDGGIAYVDEHFGRLVDGLAHLGLDDDTLVLVTADHGEAFLEHRFLLHRELYPPLLRVPLIVHDPRGSGGRVVDQRVALEDVVPTILSRTGVPLPSDLTGMRLPEADDTRAVPRPLFSYFVFGEGEDYEAFALHDERWKLVHHRIGIDAPFETELYDTRADAGETSPVPSADEVRAALEARLMEYVERGARTPEAIALDPEDLEDLRALGYVK